MYNQSSDEPQGRRHNFARLPDELKAYPQWVAFKFEERDGKQTKVPYCSTTGYPANVMNPQTWASYIDTVAAFERGYGDGIGFVFTDSDPFAGIDLDDSDGDVVIKARQDAIFDAFASYSERSPSGKGAHIIVKGSVPQGRRRDCVEVYSSGRFFTMTGNVLRDMPITNHDVLLNTLIAEMGGSIVQFDPSPYFRDATETDEAIFRHACSGTNGVKFKALWEGDGSVLTGKDHSLSAIDQALVNILQHYTNDPRQIERLWLLCPVGQREKTQNRPRYRYSTIVRAFDNELPQVDTSAILPALAGVVERAQIASRDTLEPQCATALPLVWASELANRAPCPPEWLVASWIVGRNVTLLYGDGGTGKSLLALMLAYCVAADVRWLGLKAQAGPALFLTAEDEVDEVHRRLAVISRMAGVPLNAMPHKLAIASLADTSALLAELGPDHRTLRRTALYEAVRAHIEQHCPALVVLDTLADLFGGNENDRGQARAFIAMLRSLAITYNTTIVLLAHPSRDGISSGRGDGGSTAWHNSVRSRLSMARVENEPNKRKLETKKSNYGPNGGTIELEYRDGTFVAIGAHTNDAAHRAATDTSVDEVFLALVVEFNERNYRICDAFQSPNNYAPKLFAKHVRANGYNVLQFKEAMLRLFANGRIMTVKVGEYATKKQDNIVIAASNFTSNSILK